MNDWQVVCPAIGPDQNVHGMLATLGPVDVPFLLVDNSPQGGPGRSLDVPGGVEVESHPENLGVAASWNLGVNRGADKTLILSASVRFAIGLRHFLNYADAHLNEWGLQFGGYPMQPDGLWNVGWKCIVFRRQMFDLVGTFDENFFPGYFEDLDFSYRTYLALGERLFPLAQGDSTAAGVSKVGDAIAVSNGYGFPPGVRRSGDVVRDRYRAKWGGDTCEEKFTHPFNDLSKDWRYWQSPPAREYPGPGQ